MLQEFSQEIKDSAHEMMREMHTSIPGRITAFDPAKCEASVLPLGKFKKPDGSMMDYPQINEVPVYIMQGSGQTATVVFPVKAGDECLLLFSEQALDQWRTGAESDTDLKFDLTNAIALVGVFSKPNPLMAEACATDALIIEKDGERVRIKKGETYIRDTAGQSITLTPGETTMIVNKLIIQSAGDVSITAGGEFTAVSGGDMTLTGATVNIN